MTNKQHNGQISQKDKQRAEKNTHKTKDRVTRTPLTDNTLNLAVGICI